MAATAVSGTSPTSSQNIQQLQQNNIDIDMISIANTTHDKHMNTRTTKLKTPTMGYCRYSDANMIHILSFFFNTGNRGAPKQTSKNIIENPAHKFKQSIDS